MKVDAALFLLSAGPGLGQEAPNPGLEQKVITFCRIIVRNMAELFAWRTQI
jgi:hypothetical protein